ncbi:MAG: AbrB/MazE/SpoVT family DNA-binding domain-containing protein [bacterium]
MKTRIVQIGNSQGIRIPKVMLDQSGLGDEVELKVSKEQIIISPIRKPRQGWEAAFGKMVELEEDRLLDEDELSHQSSWDDEDWVW